MAVVLEHHPGKITLPKSQSHFENSTLTDTKASSLGQPSWWWKAHRRRLLEVGLVRPHPAHRPPPDILGRKFLPPPWDHFGPSDGCPFMHLWLSSLPRSQNRKSCSGACPQGSESGEKMGAAHPPRCNRKRFRLIDTFKMTAPMISRRQMYW